MTRLTRFDDDISAERARFKSAVATDKAKIQKKIDQLKEKRKEKN
jgi:hypothetical protein